MRLSAADRASRERRLSLRVDSPLGGQVAVGELARVEATPEPQPLVRKDLKPVVYVMGDLAGAKESPVYAILALNQKLDALKLPGGAGIERYSTVTPETSERVAMKWDGEWQITYEVFRDLGIAFAVVLVLIAILVVGWFQSFTVPLAILLPIPLSLIGILPGHWAFGAFFTATSMIGFIAGAGIIVRNSIILVDFIELKLRQGMPLEQAVVEAGAVRFRPMLLTAAAVVVGSLRDAVRPDLPGARDQPDDGRGRRDPAVAARGAGRLLPDRARRPRRGAAARVAPADGAGPVLGRAAGAGRVNVLPGPEHGSWRREDDD